MLPLVHCSLPRTWPYCFSAEVSQLAASVTGAGNWVAPLTPSATPAGPSCWVTSGTHSAGIACVSPIAPLGASPLWPSIRSSLSASVIFASSIETRWLIGRLVFSHGQLATSPVVPAFARSWTATPGRADARGGDTWGRWGGVIARSEAFGCDALPPRSGRLLATALAPIASEHRTATAPTAGARNRRHMGSLLIAGLRSRDQHP